MATVSYRLEDLKKAIVGIGYVGENDHMHVLIDCKEVFDEYPDAVATMAIVPPVGESYPKVVNRNGDVVEWLVKNSDVAAEGDGEFQITFTEGEVIKKSVNGRFRVIRSISGSGNAPSGYEDWETDANEKLAAVEEATQKAEDAANHQPYIGIDGYWYTWNGEEFVKNVKAQGEKGDPGDPGSPGDPTQLIDDTDTALDKTFSSSKIDTELTNVKTDITELDETIYGEPETELTPTKIHGVNFVDGATSFVSNGSYDTFYLHVLKGEIIEWKFTKPTSSSIYLRIVYSEQIPANGVSGTQLVIPQVVVVTDHYTYQYEAQINGYLCVAMYNDSCPEEYQEAKKVKTDYGLSGLLTTSRSTSPYTINKLNAPGTTDGNFTNGAAYTTKYFRTIKGCDYEITMEVTSSTNQFRMVFSENEPSNGVPFVFVQKIEKQSGSTFTDKLYYSANADGYISIAYYNADGCTCNLTVTEIVKGDVDKLTEQVADIAGSMRGKNNTGNVGKLFLQSDALQVISNYCEMKQWTVVPYKKMVLTVNCPENVAVWFVLRVDPYTTNQDITTDPIMNGGKYIVDDGYSLYKIRFAYAKNNNGTITIVNAISTYEASVMIEKGILSITFTGSDVVSNNSDVEKEIWARIGSNPILSHISDTHGDAVRYANFMAISDHYGVDCAINSGDVANVSASDGYQYFTGEIDKHPNIPTIVCIGNHDTYATNDAAYNSFYKPFANAYDYELSTAKTYYHVDLDDANLRIIVLNIYEPRHPGYQNCITKDQIDWFIETLADTPAGYGVIVVAHCSEKLIEKDNSYPNFYSDDAPTDWTTRFDNITGNPISTIVDAFISGTSITGSYTQEIQDAENPSTTVEVTVNYSADFTSKNTGAEFVAYINGHTHYDMIGYLSDTTNTQLSLNITHGAGGQYYNSQDDIPRGNGRGSVQDAFNLYAIDRTAGKVIVCRIGSNKTYALTDRKIMAIPYK